MALDCVVTTAEQPSLGVRVDADEEEHLTKKYYQVPISVVLIVTKPVIITAGRYGVIQMQIQTHKRSTNRLRRNLL